MLISHPLAEPLQPLQVGVLVKVRVHVFQETCVEGVVLVGGVSDKIKMSAYQKIITNEFPKIMFEENFMKFGE